MIQGHETQETSVGAALRAAQGQANGNTQGQQYRQQQQQRVQQDDVLNFHSQGGMFDRPLNFGVNSEYFNDAMTLLTARFSGVNDKYTVDLVPLDNVNFPNMTFGTIIVGARSKQDMKTMAYHILILEVTGPELTPVIETINNCPVEVFRPTSMAFNQNLILEAEKQLAARFPGVNLVNVDATVIPRTMSLKNADGKISAMLDRVAINTSLACSTELRIRVEQRPDLNIARLDRKSSVLENRVTFGSEQTVDDVGNLNRTDFRVNLVSKQKGSGNQGNYILNDGNKEVVVSEIGGYVELYWYPGQNTNNGGYGQPAPTQRYIPNIILTHLKSDLLRTPAMLGLAIAQAFSITDDNNWLQCFRSGTHKGGGRRVDIRDPGALNIEANLGGQIGEFSKRVNTKGDDFTFEMYSSYLRDLIRPTPLISIDCLDMGPNAWWLAPLVSAADGNSNAYKVMYDSFDHLTNGNFSRYFAYGTEMFINPNNRIHFGSFKDNDGVDRDIRTIDHIAVCNIVGEQEPKRIRDWSDTWLRTQYPLVQRLAERANMYRQFTHESAVFTGMGTRVTISLALAEALAKSFRDMQLPIRTTSPMSGSEFDTARAIANFADQGFGASSVFTNNTAGGYGAVWQGPAGYNTGGSFRF